MESPSQEQEIINSGQLTPGFSWSSDIISQCKMWVCWFCCNVCRKWGRYVPFLLNIANKEAHCQKTNWRGLCLTACMQPAYVMSSIWLVSCHHTTLPSSKSLQWREDGWASWQWRRLCIPRYRLSQEIPGGIAALNQFSTMLNMFTSTRSSSWLRTPLLRQ